MSHLNIPDRFSIEKQARELRRAKLARLSTATVDALLVAIEKSAIMIARALRRVRLTHRERAAQVTDHALAH